MQQVLAFLVTADIGPPLVDSDRRSSTTPNQVDT